MPANVPTAEVTGAYDRLVSKPNAMHPGRTTCSSFRATMKTPKATTGPTHRWPPDLSSGLYPGCHGFLASGGEVVPAPFRLSFALSHISIPPQLLNAHGSHFASVAMAGPFGVKASSVGK